MSSTFVGPSTSVSDLASTLMRRLDRDNDGKLSTTEFTDFLTAVLGALEKGANAPASASGLLAHSAAAGGSRPRIGTMSGFSEEKLANPAHDTFKYQMGRILQYYPNTPAGLRDALPEIQQIVPGARITGSKGDKIDFGDYIDNRGHRIGIIDVIRASGAGGTAWQWLPVE